MFQLEEVCFTLGLTNDHLSFQRVKIPAMLHYQLQKTQVIMLNKIFPSYLKNKCSYWLMLFSLNQLTTLVQKYTIYFNKHNVMHILTLAWKSITTYKHILKHKFWNITWSSSTFKWEIDKERKRVRWRKRSLGTRNGLGNQLSNTEES